MLQPLSLKVQSWIAKVYIWEYIYIYIYGWIENIYWLKKAKHKAATNVANTRKNSQDNYLNEVSNERKKKGKKFLILSRNVKMHVCFYFAVITMSALAAIQKMRFWIFKVESWPKSKIIKIYKNSGIHNLDTSRDKKFDAWKRMKISLLKV